MSNAPDPNADADTSANVDPDDLKPDTSENKTDKKGGKESGKKSGKDYQKLSQGEVEKLENAGIDVHFWKGKKGASRRDLYKDKNGNIIILGKGGVGEPDPTGYNINDF